MEPESSLPYLQAPATCATTTTTTSTTTTTTTNNNNNVFACWLTNRGANDDELISRSEILLEILGRPNHEEVTFVVRNSYVALDFTKRKLSCSKGKVVPMSSVWA